MDKITCLCPTHYRPNCLFDAIYTFCRQTHQNKKLLILDDTGSYGSLDYRGVQLVSINKAFRTLPEKYNAMVGMSDHDSANFAVWEDDDLYMPWHLKSITEALEQSSSPTAYHFHKVLSDDGEKFRIEDTGGRFHASLGFNRECFEKTNGWIVTPEASFDLQLIQKLQPFIVRNEQEPSYYFRWGSSFGYHGQTAMNGYHDRDWTAKAQKTLKQVHINKMGGEFDYRLKHFCMSDPDHKMLRKFIDFSITQEPNKEYDFASLLRPTVKMIGELQTLDFAKLNLALNN